MSFIPICAEMPEYLKGEERQGLNRVKKQKFTKSRKTCETHLGLLIGTHRGWFPTLPLIDRCWIQQTVHSFVSLEISPAGTLMEPGSS